MKGKNHAVNDKKTESINDLKKQTTANNAVKKGYNENNPVQPQGAFKPDSATRKN